MVAQYQTIFQLLLAVTLCGLIGLEREMKRKGAGLQTYSLIGLSACMFTILTLNSINAANAGAFDSSHVIQAIATGIGFIGAGLIFRREKEIEGLTTAAGLLVVAAIGIAVGMEAYFLAVAGTLLMLFVLIVFGLLEKKYFK